MKLKSRLILITLTLLFFFVSPLPTLPQERTSPELPNNQSSSPSQGARDKGQGTREEKETSKPALDEEATEEPFKPTFEVSGYKTINLRSVSIRGNYARFMSDQYYQPGFSMEQKTQVELKGQITEGTKVSASLNDSIPVLPGQSQKLRISLESKYFGVTFGESNLSFENAEFTLFNKRLAGLSGYVQIGSRVKGQETRDKGQGTRVKGQEVREDLPLKIQFLSAKSEGIAQQDEFATDKSKLTYTLTHRPVVVASERVRIDNNYQKRDKDYEIDYIQGTITFKNFLEDNQTIYVDYEYSPSATGIFERELLGLRGESRIGKRLFLGTTYLQELDTGGGASLLDINATPMKHQLWGIDGRYKLGEIAIFSSEFAQSTYNPNTQDYVTIDDMEETPTALRIVDGEKISLWDINGAEDKDPYNSTLQIKENKEELKEGSSSLSLTYCLNPSGLDNPAFVYAYQTFSPEEVVDWTNRYLRLELWVYGDNKEENLSINLGADKDNYYYYTQVVDFSGWKKISLRIPEDLEEHGELSLANIQQIRIYLDNQTTNSLISGEIYVDGIKALERSPLTERWGNIKTDGVSQVLVEGSSQAIEGESSLSLEYSFDENNPQAYVEVGQIFSTYQNWTNYKELSFFLYGDNNQEEFSLDLGKDEDNYYRYSRIIDFSGWKQITLNLAEDFNKKGEVFLSQIKEIKWTIKSTPEIVTYHSSLYIDSLSLSQVSVIRGEAYRFSAQAKLKDLSLGINYKKRGSTFASIGSAFLNLTQENLQANLSYQGKSFALSSEYSEQTDQGDYKRSTIVHNNSLNIKPGKAPQIRTNFKQRKEKNELPGGELDQIINTTTLGLSHQVRYISLSSSYFQEGLKDRLDPSKDLLTLGEGVQLSTVGKKKVSASFDYNARRQREKATHQDISQTTTSTLSLKLSPSKRISAEGELNQREVKDLKNKTSTTSTIANFKLEAKPSNKLAGGVKYDVTNTVNTINGVATPVETSNVIYQIRALPTKEISLFTEYRLRDTRSSGGEASVYESDKTTIEVRYEPKARDKGQGARGKGQEVRGKWQSNIKYEVEDSSKPGDFDRQVQVTTLGLNTSLTPDLTLTLGEKLENNKEVSIRGKTDLLSSTTTLGLSQKINKATQATLGYSTSIRDDKVAGLKTGTYNLVSGMTWTPRERVKLKSEFKTGKTLQGRKNEFNLGFDYNPNEKITITSKLSTIQAKDYSANLFTTEAKVNF